MRGIGGLWLHAVPLIALSQIAVYGWLPVELQVVMAVAAVAYRRCGRPEAPEPAAPAVASAQARELTGPGRVRALGGLPT